jgi:hypothetical protein
LVRIILAARFNFAVAALKLANVDLFRLKKQKKTTFLCVFNKPGDNKVAVIVFTVTIKASIFFRIKWKMHSCS